MRWNVPENTGRFDYLDEDDKIRSHSQVKKKSGVIGCQREIPRSEFVGSDQREVEERVVSGSRYCSSDSLDFALHAKVGVESSKSSVETHFEKCFQYFENLFVHLFIFVSFATDMHRYAIG